MSKLKERLSGAFIRYALSYFLLVAVLLVAFSAYTYYDYDQAMRAQVTESGLNKLNRLCYQNERYLSNIINISEQLSLSPYIKPFRFEQQPQKAYELLQQLTPYTVTNEFVDQFFLFFRTDEYVYSSASSMKLDLFLDSLVRFEQVSPETLRELLMTCDRITIFPVQQVRSLLLDGSEERMVTILAPLGVNYRNAKGTLIYMVKESDYIALLSDAIEDNTNTYILYQDQVLVSSEHIDISHETVLASVRDNKSTLTTELTANGRRYLLLALKGDAQGMQYATLLPMQQVTAGVQSGFGRFAVVAAALMVLCLPLVYMLTRKNTLPLLELRDFLVKDGRTSNPLDDIQEGIHQLIGQNAALTTRLDSSLPMQKHNFVLNFMKGRYPSRFEAVRAAAEAGMNIDRKCAAVLLCSATDKQSRPTDVAETPLAQSGLISGYGAELMAYDQHLYLVFADDPLALDAFARYLLESGKQKTRQAAVAISDVFSDFTAAAAAYLEAATAYDNRMVMGDERVLRFCDIHNDSVDLLPQARSYADAIHQAMRLGNREQLDRKLTELMQFLKRTSMSLFSFRLIYNDVIDTLLGGGATMADLSAAKIYDVFTLSSCHSLDDLDNLLRVLCERLMSAAPDARDEADDISRVVAYIGDHFTEPDLSMTRVAELFGLSTAKLSMAFKELTNITPSDYLLMLRIEKAKELLAHTELSIKEISAAVGYYDSSGFIRRFKQYSSITPLQYRQSLKKGEDQDA